MTKHAIKVSGESAAELLHRYLTLGATADLPATELTLFHGLTLDRQFDLGSGAFLAPYEEVKARYGLPDQPDAWLSEAASNSGRSEPATEPSVLVREMTWGPGVAPEPPGDLFGTRRAVDWKVGYRFPDDYKLALNEHTFPDDYRVLMALLSIAARSPLLARTRFTRVAKWIEESDPNFAFGTMDGGRYIADRRPRGRPLTCTAPDFLDR